MSNIVDRDGFVSLIQSITGLKTVYWATNGQPFISDEDRMSVELEIFSVKSLGVDEHRPFYSAPGYPANSYVITEVGNREVIMTIRVRAFDGNTDASEMLDVIKTLLRSAASTAALNALSLAVEWMGPSVRIVENIDTRRINTSVADFRFGGISQMDSSLELNQGWIDTVDGNNIVPGDLT